MKSLSVKEKSAVKKRYALGEEKISFITRLMVESAGKEHLRKIFLFGSHVCGSPNKRSDIDLCVIIKDKYDTTSVYMKMAVTLYDNGIMPVDLLVYKEKEFYNFENPNGIEKTIISEGRVLYE